MSPLPLIHSITNRILNAPKNAAGELFVACNELYKVLLQITGIDLEEAANRQTQTLESGHAIGLTWAAMCIQDYMRTKRFMDGIYQATNDKLKTITGRPVHILYAGTGPFAALILPLTARFNEKQIQFILLEVNEQTFNCLQKMVDTLQLQKYIHRIEKADATKWKLPSNEPVDIFISETMQQALVKEPQVELCMNIQPQLPPGAIIIPEQIILQAALIDLPKRMHNKRLNNNAEDAVHVLDTIFTLSKQTILQHAGSSHTAFPEITVCIPGEILETHSLLYLLTEIIIYKQEKLLIDKSQLTLPLKLCSLNGLQTATLKFQYHTGKTPGIQFSINQVKQHAIRSSL